MKKLSILQPVMTTNLPETAPKDGTIFLANIGLPWYVMCCWNGALKKWSFVSPQTGMFQGKLDDTYFETEWDKETALITWIELPPI